MTDGAGRLYSFVVAVLPIITGADTPVLRTPTALVPKVTKDVLHLIRNMEETCVHADGLGLAAPQVGQSLRVCIAKINDRLTPLINPRITWRSPAMDDAEEGCLSLPGVYVHVRRPQSIVVEYTDVKGRAQERRLADLDARVVQHEVDHLDGVLIVDYVGVDRSRKTEDARTSGV
ncbi:MAG: methionyl-tRNA formyltransferase [Candidatus Peregrinibacteria bacterium Gr01-1014_25]|nr:MAG: methionyl-tRNA formyltransferase [Candidatus Peregrinibacteria bacterium Gr01-1014_25]